jgi:hypothetical protein
MGTEQTYQQAKMRCLILEADRDAESLRADKYRKILDTVIGEGSPDAAESQAARSLHAARDPLVRRSVACCRPCFISTLETS